MKDGGKSPLFNFYGTGAKAYYANAGNIVDKEVKDIKRDVIKNLLCEADYKELVEKYSVKLRKMNIFQTYIRLTNNL